MMRVLLAKFLCGNKGSRCIFFIIASTMLWPLMAAEKDFADAPLFLDTRVQPNIIFGVDDSGSMVRNTIFSTASRLTIDGLDNIGDGLDRHPPYTGVKGFLVCSGINLMYYDPDKTYTPWKGLNNLKEAFGDFPSTSNPGQAPKDPFYPNANLVELNSSGKSDVYDAAGYFKWVDLNNNGEWDFWVDMNGNGEADDWVDDGDGTFEVGESEFECPVPSDVASLFKSYYRAPTLNLLTGTDKTDQLQTWFTSFKEMNVAQQKNFANWYSYYRRRQYVVIAALTNIVNDSIARVGLKTLNNVNSVDLALQDIDDLSTPVDTTAAANKAALLAKINRIGGSGTTPLRATLQAIGETYANTTNSPILPADEGGTCQQNFAILMSDGQWNGGKVYVDTGDKTLNPDSDNNSEWDGGTYADNEMALSTTGNSLADIAMYYYETDLRPSFDDNVPIILGVDENPAQHMVTYTVAFGLTGTLDPDIAPDDPEFAGWPTAEKNTSTSIDDVRHAAYNGRGLYLEAYDPEKLIDSFDEAINDIQERTGSASNVAVNSGSYTSLLQIFQAQFNSLSWDGTIKAYGINEDGSIESTVKEASVVPAANQRKIYSWDGTKGISFIWGNLSADQKTVVGKAAVLNYIRGTQYREEGQPNSAGFNYRARELSDNGSSSPLGDFVHSSPVYVGEPEFNYPDSLEDVSYSSYRLNPDHDQAAATDKEKTVSGQVIRRQPILYAGANDGMLHAFNVDPDPTNTDYGKEVFAYIPSSVYHVFDDLINPYYTHTYSVDGTPYVGDAFFNSQWNTVLVGGLNAGGQGIYALNVTDPDLFAKTTNADDIVLWEFTDTPVTLTSGTSTYTIGDADLGYTYSKPIIAKSHHGDLDRWVAIFGNGYNSAAEDSSIGSGKAVLYIVDLETGALIKKIDTGVNELTTANGLSSPTTVDLDGDSIADYVYAGDREGNVWKFDISSEDSSTWDVAYKVGGVNKPLFTACGDATCTISNRQPITVQPQVTRNTGADKGLLVYVATGSYLYDIDLQDTSTQSIYGIWDRGVYDASLTRSNLLAQAITSEAEASFTDADGVQTTSDVRNVSANAISWYDETGGTVTVNHRGWYLDLYNQAWDKDNKPTSINSTDPKGERVVYDFQIRRGFIVFSTLIPDDDPCQGGIDGWTMALKAHNGARPDNDEPFFDINNDSVVNSSDVWEFSSGANAVGGVRVPSTGCVIITLENGDEVCIYNPTDGGSPTTSSIGGGHDLGRWVWRDLSQ